MQIEHIGIAVKDLDASNALFEKLLGEGPYKQETVEAEGVVTSFFRSGEGKVELLQATREDSPIAKFLLRGKEGLHHVAFAVDDIYAEMARLRGEGFTLLSDSPKRGADNKLVVFLHPAGTNGVLVELCQEIKSTQTDV
ncbi:Lactoylglutathione lyase [Lunatimonas lonarensis]|uniref:Lactoylglutathione lyase n=1 Tax=Lunatimonas lonarensis TaxID=1232681 RepID=R7ZSC2_9BACT|nr:methylmalonyl-CoA epimerase [Lunatimonas lonarensis]EON76948.1 Lactoylglutathione lyase [Lunatimonas lonarensis]